MSWEHTEDWLKNTVPGIIVLGATGSILAYYLIKLFRVAFLKVLDGVMFSHLRPFVLSQLLTIRFLKRNDLPRLITWLLFTIVGFLISTGIFMVFTVLAAVYFTAFGIHSTRLAVTIVAIVGLSGIFWFRDCFTVMGVAKELLFTDYKELKALLKEKGAVIALAKHFNAELQQPSKESPKQERTEKSEKSGSDSNYPQIKEDPS